MAVPDFYKLRRPFLEALLGGETRRIRDIGADVAKALDLSDGDLAEVLPSGTQTRFLNRIHWTRTYLGKAELIDSPTRGYVKINERGRALLKKELGDITDELLKDSILFKNFINNSTISVPFSEVESTFSPEEEVDQVFNTWKDKFSQELLDQVKQVTWEKFEELVVH